LGLAGGLAGPSEISARSVEQSSSLSVATGIDAPAFSSPLAAALHQQQLALRQPPAAAETAAARGLTLVQRMHSIARQKKLKVKIFHLSDPRNLVFI